MTEHIKIESKDDTLTLTCARPDKKNALTKVMYGALADALLAAETDPAARVVVLRGEGDMFTAGNDVGEFAAIATGAFKGEPHVARFLQAIALATRPLVAAVQGRAVGVGTTMLLHCDFVLLAEDALLSTPFVNLALVPEAASTILMPQRIGHARAYAMFALGEIVDAKSALALGIANRVVPLERLHAEAASVAQRLAKLPMGSLAATKRLMRSGRYLENGRAGSDRMHDRRSRQTGPGNHRARTSRAGDGCSSRWRDVGHRTRRIRQEEISRPEYHRHVGARCAEPAARLAISAEAVQAGRAAPGDQWRLKAQL
jgi:enoyl-CoA hydratase/carnithine racemase